MGATLAVNPGSSSRKYELYRGTTRIFTAVFEQTGEGYGMCTAINDMQQTCTESSVRAYDAALDECIKIACERGLLKSPKEITRVGVRIVCPGTYFAKHQIITDGYIERLKKMYDAAPLHIPHMLTEIAALGRVLPHAHVVGVSDSAFHATIPSHVRTYSIDALDSDALDIYRFGYHGLSVASVVRRTTEIRGTFPERAIVCHVGSGVSVTTLMKGKSVDTTMGFGPMSGLMMNTRVGDIDPSALLYLMEKKKWTPLEAATYLNSKCGIRGMLGHSDLRVTLERLERGDTRATQTVAMYIYRIKKAIGAAVATLGGVDLLVLTATAPERNPTVRALICADLAVFGITLDVEKNDALIGNTGWIHGVASSAEVLVVHTEEMGEIARVADSCV